MEIDGDDGDNWSIFSITDQHGSGHSREITPDNGDMNKYLKSNEIASEIGMGNFKTKRKSDPTGLANTISIKSARDRWHLAIKKTKLLNDPWSEFHIEVYKPENVIRHRYNAIKKKWIQDKSVVKMELKPFANGAMRECYRLKKLSNFSHKQSWETASNYVAKCYKHTDTPRDRYFDEVKLQMDAKLWAEAYNRHNPPKKVDMFQMCILEFVERTDSPLFHLEHYIEGNYIKYNSNSGFVDDGELRNTPQAFSHFTFECSNHELIVVDIQGVGDLWTDPQIHTAKGVEYGDGNLGTKGMALFFHSHICNDICMKLGLTPFDLTDSELKDNEKLKASVKRISPLTVCRGQEEMCVGSPTCLGEYFRSHSFHYKSQNSICSDNSSSNDAIDESEGYESESPGPVSPIGMLKSSNAIPFSRPQRIRTQSSLLDSLYSPDDASYFNSTLFNHPRPSCVLAECAAIEEENSDSVLGRLHLDLCKYHELGRFVGENEEFDSKAAFYHLRQAAKLNVLEALLNISKIYLNLPRDILSSYTVPESDENVNIAFDYIYQAAEKGDKNSILYIAKAYDTGSGLHTREKINWKLAVDWYKKVVENLDEDEKLMDDMGYSEAPTMNIDEPTYSILGRLAELFQHGGNGLAKNLSDARDYYNDAAEKAMSYGKGRVANKYYMLAETMSSEMD